MNFLKILTFVLALSLTVGLIACSDDNNDETLTDENQTVDTLLKTSPNTNQQGAQGNQQRQQQMQQQQMQQIKPGTDTTITKENVIIYLNKMIEFVESNEYISQLRRAMQPGQNQQQVMAERKKMQEMSINILKKSGFPNGQSFEYCMIKYQQDIGVKQVFEKLNATANSKMKIIKEEINKQQQGNQQNQKPINKSN